MSNCNYDHCCENRCDCEEDRKEKHGRPMPYPRSDYAKIVNQTTQTIGVGAPLVFNELSIIRGNTVRFMPPSANITLAGGAVYYIIYETQAYNPAAVAGTTAITTRLFLDENPISGTIAQEVIQFNERGQLVSFTILAAPCGAPNVLQLRNESPEARNFFDANITIVRIG